MTAPKNIPATEQQTSTTTSLENRMDRIEAVLEKLVNIHVAGQTTAIPPQPIGGPTYMDAMEKMALEQKQLNEWREQNLKRVTAEHDRLDAELGQGAKQFLVRVISNEPGKEGTVVNRERSVGGRDKYEAQAKYQQFYGIKTISAPSELEVVEVGSGQPASAAT